MIDRAQLERPAPLSLFLTAATLTPQTSLLANTHKTYTVRFNSLLSPVRAFNISCVCVCVCVYALSEYVSQAAYTVYALSVVLHSVCFILESPGRQTGQQAAPTNVIQQAAH